MCKKIIFSLLFFLSIPIFGMQNALLVKVASRPIETGKYLGKISGGILTVLAINSALEYISSYAGLHVVGIASRDPNYKVVIPNSKNLSQLIAPRGHVDYDKSNKTYKISMDIAGPLTKTSTTIAQITGLEIIHKSIGKSPSYATAILSCLKFARIDSAVSTIARGFLPIYFNKNDDNRPGHEIWKWLTGNDNFPAMYDKYHLLALATTLLSIYISLKLNLISINL